MEVHHWNRKRWRWTLGVISATLVIIATYAADNCTNGNCTVEVVPRKVAPRRARETFHRSAVLHQSKGSCGSSADNGAYDISSSGRAIPREKMSRGFDKSCDAYQSGMRGDRLYGQIHCTNVTQVVSGLSSAIIDFFIVKESSFGMNRTGFLSLIDRAKELFQTAIKGWESSDPSIEKFLMDTAAVLNQLKISNDQMRMKFEELAAAIVNGSGSQIEPIIPVFNETEGLGNISKRSVPDPTVYNAPTNSRKSYRRQNKQNSKNLRLHRGRTFGGRAANRKLPKKIGMGRGTGEASGGKNEIPDVQYTRTEQKPEGKWWVGVQEVVGYLESTSLWTTFFKEFHEQLETDKIQIARIKGELAFHEWRGSNNISENNLEEALNKILEEFKLPSLQNNLEALKNSVNGIKLNYFNELVRSDLKQEAVCIPSDKDTLVAGSSYYFTSQLLECINKTRKKVSTVIAVAVNRMFFDQDVKQGSNESSHGYPFDFIFVSPEWHVLGTRTFILSGEKGGNNASILGSPGHPGFPGKRFYGIAEQIIGGELTIMSNGGNGGPGVIGGVEMATGLASLQNGWTTWKGNDCICLGPDVCGKDCFFTCPYYRGGEVFPRHGSHGGKGAEGGPKGIAEIIFIGNGNENGSENENQTVLPPNLKIVLNEGKAGAGGPGGKGVLAKPADLTDPERRRLLTERIDYYHFKDWDKNFWHWCLPWSRRGKQQHASANTGKAGGDIRPPELPLPRLEFDSRLLGRAIVEYYKLSRLGSNSISRKKIHQFTESFHENNTLDAALLSVDLVTIFTHLEEQSALYFPHVPLHIYYSKIGKIAQERLKNVTKDQFSDDYRALNFLRSSVEAKKLSASSPNDPIIVVDITEHLKGEQKVVQNMLRATELSIQYRQVNMVLNQFHKRIESLFEEAGYYTEKILLPEIAAIRSHFDKFIVYLVRMIESLIQASHNAREELRRYQLILIAYTVVDVVFIGIGFAASILSMLNQAGYLLTYAAGIVRKLLPTEPGQPGGLPQLPSAIYGGNLAAAFRFRRNANASLSAFLTQVKYTAAVMYTHKDAFAEGLKTAEYFYTLAENSAPNPNKTMDDYPVIDNVKSFRSMIEVDEFIKAAQKNISEKIAQVKSKRSVRSTAEWNSMEKEKDVSPFNQAGQHHQHRSKREFKFDLKDIIKDFPTSFGINDAIKLGMTIIDTSENLIAKLLGRYNQFNAVQKAIESIPAQVAALRDYENRIKDGLVGEIDDLFGEFADLTSDLAGRSRTQLSLIKWRIQTTIRDAKLQLSEEYIKGLPIVPFFLRGLERLEEAYTVMVTIYENLADYQEQANLAGFTAQVSADPRYYLGKLNNEELGNAVEKLRFILQGQVIVKRHQLTVSTFRLWRFPFVTATLCEGYSREIGANMSDVSQLNLMLQTVDSYLDTMASEVSQGVSSIVGSDEFVIQTSWDIESGVPYFTWANESFYSEIKQVLSVENGRDGEPVQLYANPLQAPRECGAYKFNKIILFFTKVGDLTALEKDLHKALDSFDVNLHHRGSNHYVFNDQIWTLPTGDANMKFSFRLRSDGRPTTVNVVYTKLLQGDFTLSPYGHWSLYFSKRVGPPFISLKPWIGKVDMHLGGEGTCVTPQFLQKNKFIPPDCSTYMK